MTRVTLADRRRHWPSAHSCHRERFGPAAISMCRFTPAIFVREISFCVSALYILHRVTLSPVAAAHRITAVLSQDVSCETRPVCAHDVSFVNPTSCSVKALSHYARRRAPVRRIRTRIMGNTSRTASGRAPSGISTLSQLRRLMQFPVR